MNCVGGVSQGDIFDSLPLIYVSHGSSNQTIVEETRAILLTYDCEYDKPSTQFVMAASVYSLAEVPAERRGNVRKNKVFSAFYLPPHPNFDECFVDFRFMAQLEKAVVAARAGAGKRLTSLDDEAQLALQEQLSAFFGYGRGR